MPVTVLEMNILFTGSNQIREFILYIYIFKLKLQNSLVLTKFYLSSARGQVLIVRASIISAISGLLSHIKNCILLLSINLNSII